MVWGGPGNQLFGSLAVTIPVNEWGVNSVYTLADNTFGVAAKEEYDVTFTPGVWVTSLQPQGLQHELRDEGLR